MACGICEHCHSPVWKRDEVATREGFSYHKKCHKCYVCSETNLHDAEVFKGVIFCSSCAQRIFQGCASVRKTKQQVSNRVKHSRSKSRRRRDHRRTQEKRMDRDVNHVSGVIELAQLAGSTSGSCDAVAAKLSAKHVFKTSKEATTMMPVQVEQQGYDFPHKKSMKTISLDMGTTTIVTEKLLKQVNDPEIGYLIKPASVKEAADIPTANVPRNITPIRYRKKKKDIVPPRTNKQIVSDLRIAELGASTEIANMALRKKSELPVIIKSDTAGVKEVSSDTLSVLNQESAESRDEKDWVHSKYSSVNRHKGCLDRRLGSIVKLPYKFFKKNILTRSSLISIAMSNDYAHMSLLKRFKTLFYEEITTHQGRGITRLYSTINRRKTPYKLGWLNLVATVSKAMNEPKTNLKDIAPEKTQHRKRNRVPKKPCKHFKASHSYRCMRAQAMRLAGPTPSQLAGFRKKIKKFVAPKCVRHIARGFCNQQDQKTAEEPKICEVETVFKAPPTRRPDNTWGNIGKAYVHLWTAVM